MRGILCKLGLHKWKITKWISFRDKKCRHKKEEGFDRVCKFCEKEQRLKRPKEYHPTNYVWTDIIKAN
jgi:hypothetical protein